MMKKKNKSPTPKRYRARTIHGLVADRTEHHGNKMTARVRTSPEERDVWLLEDA
jgi:hypothetical protein